MGRTDKPPKSGKTAVVAGVLLLFSGAALAWQGGWGILDLARLLPWMGSPSGLGSALVLLVRGMVAGVEVGPPTPALEGIGVVAAFSWLPGLFAPCEPLVQSAVVLVLLSWVLSFVWMFHRVHVARKSNWDCCSLRELLLVVTRRRRR